MALRKAPDLSQLLFTKFAGYFTGESVEGVNSRAAVLCGLAQHSWHGRPMIAFGLWVDRGQLYYPYNHGCLSGGSYSARNTELYWIFRDAKSSICAIPLLLCVKPDYLWVSVDIRYASLRGK